MPANRIFAFASHARSFEFVLPRLDVLCRTLARILASQCFGERGWSLQQKLDLAHTVLDENPQEFFYPGLSRD
ncbi:hypothetical protein JW992_01395 [candidate division KSB1 bacterium]|nr:hypothetical protein [candidate division KSB1 bacterium]